jgi:putative tryptophan/tyrosine transport system substrate-binding protein
MWLVQELATRELLEASVDRLLLHEERALKAIAPLRPRQQERTAPRMPDAPRNLGLPLSFQSASTELGLDAIFATFAQHRVRALLINADSFFTSRRAQIVRLAAHYAIPTIYAQREFAAAGGLISYTTSLADAYRLAGIYTARILPADLPVQQSTKVELIINLKTAKALGLIVPKMLLARADEVIE